MPLLNDPGSLPSPMWALTRLLVSRKGDCPAALARELLCPPSLMPGEGQATAQTFEWAAQTLEELGIIVAGDDRLKLTTQAAGIKVGDPSGFADALRSSVLEAARNQDLGENSDQSTPRDLVRALAWFLDRDPLIPMGWREAAQQQEGAFPAKAGKPIVNDFRWNRFVTWAPALGFASIPALGPNEQGQRLIPDCTTAVLRAVASLWKAGTRIGAAEAIDRIVSELPILPGGRYSLELGLPPPKEVPATLSFALLCGQDQGVLTLERRSDAAGDVYLADPDAASGTRRISEVVVHGGIDA